MGIPSENAVRAVFAAMARLLFSGSLTAQAPPPASATGIVFAADVPLIESSGIPCVEVRLGDGPALLFGIDTGNVNTTVDTKTAKSGGFEMTAYPPPVPEGFYKASIPPLHLGAVTVAGRHALAFDYAANKMPAALAGTIAYTAFKDRIVQIDFAARRVRISDIVADPVSMPGPRDSFSLVNFGNHGPPIVVAHGFELNGKPVSAQVDTMYTGSFLVYSASVPKLGLESSAKTQVTEFFPITDGGVNMKVAEARSESFNGTDIGGSRPRVYFPTPGVHEPDGLFDATVGVALFRGAVLTMDFHGNTISVRKAPSPG
jgi:hypothetical protein